MLTSAERHKRVADRAEANHQFDFAAHEFFEASKKFRDDGRPKEAEEMRAQERRVLSKVVMLSDSANEIESQARKLTGHASELAQCPVEDTDNPAPDLYRLAAGLYEEAADRYLAIADQTEPGERKREYISKAAMQLQIAGRNLARAANSSSNPEAEQEARDLYWRASRLQSQGVEAGETHPVDSSEIMGTQLTLARLRKSGGMKCRECDLLWKAYTESSRRHAALSSMHETGDTKNANLNQHVATAAEWWRVSIKAVLDHEANHRVENGSSPDPSSAKNTILVGRAS